MAQYIEDSSLEDWKVIGSGGFGLIYKARHRQLACDVAVKLLHYDGGTNEFMLREINMMRQGSSPHVVHVHGVFRGRPPSSGSQSAQLGVVMELMDRGSLFSLQTEKMEKPIKVLLETLDSLTADDFKRFKWYLQKEELLKGFPAILKRRLEDADSMDTVDQMFQTYDKNTIKVTRIVLAEINRNDLVEYLSENISEPAVEEIQLSGASAGLNPFRVVRGGEQRLEREDMRRYSCELTVDTNTMNRKLKLSDNNRKVTNVKQSQSYPDHPDRFNSCPQLLCRGCLTGRCYWEVEWRGWVHVSVSYRGISRKGDRDDCGYGRNDQSWRLYCDDLKGYSVCHNNRSTSITSSSVSDSVSHRVAVYVDCPAGTLSFFIVSSDTLIHLHTFNTTFTEPLYPGFGVGSESSVSLCSL